MPTHQGMRIGQNNTELSEDEKLGGCCVLRRDGCVSLVGNRFSPSAQVLCPTAPRTEPPAPDLDGGPRGAGG